MKVEEWSGAPWAWLVARWSLGGEPTAWAALLAVGVVVATILVPPAWHAARNVVTVVHEMGHVGAALLCGRRVQGIRLHTDTSGLAITRGSPRGPGMLLTALAGYPAPGVVGAALTWAAVSGRAGAALMLLVAVLVAALLLVRNLWGLLVVLGSLIGAGLVLWRGEEQAVTPLVLVLGLFLAVGSVRAAWDLCAAHLRGDASQSDAVSAAQASLLPAAAWLGLFSVVTAACAGAALWLVGGALLRLVG
ncbi:MAG: M50 family metallopeptidase [Kocuria sp.]|nr:M50 family metallopeptidase [Kocuria sp.]